MAMEMGLGASELDQISTDNSQKCLLMLVLFLALRESLAGNSVVVPI